MFFPDSPSRCAASARFLYKMFRHPEAQFFRMYESFPDASALRGSLYGSGFALQYSVRAQALLRMLVFMWLLHTASLSGLLRRFCRRPRRRVRSR